MLRAPDIQAVCPVTAQGTHSFAFVDGAVALGNGGEGNPNRGTGQAVRTRVNFIKAYVASSQ
jgi:hypothetical protein